MKKKDYPSHISFYSNGLIQGMVWEKKLFKDRCPHRENNLPSIITFYEDGKLESLMFHRKGRFYTEGDFPTWVSYTRKGKKYYQSWKKNGVKHRLYAPCTIITEHINDYLFKQKEEWWINNKQITNQVQNFINEFKLPDWQQWTSEHKILFKLRFIK